tara:strand:- start:56932 stop:57576 length:645 start_codon:yes stop_codon:yes gene_type:complete
MKFLGYDRVLCLSPHPDDVEYSMSGTIYKHRSTLFDVVLLSHGTVSDKSTSESRIHEAYEFWQSLDIDEVNLNLSQLKTSGNFDTLLDSGWVDLIEKQFTNKYKYDAIIGPSSEDSHYEHQITNRVMNSLSRSKPLSILEYKSPSTLHSWTPNLFVSLENFYKLKTEYLRNSFKSQTDALYFSEECIKLFHEDYNYKKRGISSAEQFKIKTLFK